MGRPKLALTGDQNEILSVAQIAKVVKKGWRYVNWSMDLYQQTKGERGLPFVVCGSRRFARRKSIDLWLTREEEEMACI